MQALSAGDPPPRPQRCGRPPFPIKALTVRAAPLPPPAALDSHTYPAATATSRSLLSSSTDPITHAWLGGHENKAAPHHSTEHKH